jgi:hypothetical protein
MKRASILSVLAVCILSAIDAFAGHEKHQQTGSDKVLDGQIFFARMAEKGKDASATDVIEFRDGMFHSKACDVYGFGEAPYSATRTAAGIVFEVQTQSPTAGTLKWKGTIKEDRLEGHMVEVKEDASSVEHPFTGEVVHSGLLDGRTVVAKSGEKGKDLDSTDVIEFHDGLFHSRACDAYGFGEAPYSATRTSEGIVFEVQTQSPTAGTLKWKGTIAGNDFAGESVLVQEGKNSMEYVFKGETASGDQAGAATPR